VPWVRFDDQFPIHRKVAGLSDRAFRLHAEAIFWCARNLTDGRVSAADLPQICRRFAASKRSLRTQVEELILRGNWHPAGEDCPSEKCPAPMDGDGWVIHDYLDYQPSAARVRQERDAKAARQQRWVAKQTRRKRDASQDPSTDTSQDASTDVTPSRTRIYRAGVVTEPVRSSPPQRSFSNGQINPADGAAARHPSARPLADALGAAGLEPAQQPARGETVTNYADQIRRAINNTEGGQP
jgi:hypothetical protein